MAHLRSLLALPFALALAASPLRAAPAVAPTKGKAAKAPSEKQIATNKAKVDELRRKGLAAAEAGKDEEALAAFAEVIKLDERDEVSHAELGKIFFKQGKLPEAIARFQAAVKLDPKDSLAWYNLAYASRKDKQFAQAAEAYQKYSQLVPDDADGLFGLAESLRQASKAQEAIGAYEAYVKKETRPSEQKWVDRSKERITELKAQVEKDTVAKAEAERVAAAKEAADAKVTANASAALPPAAAADGARTVKHGADERPAAAKVVAPVQPREGDTPAVSRIAEGDRLFAGKDYRGALFSFQDAVQADPKSTVARVRVGDCYVRLGYTVEAVEQYNKALALEPNNLAAREGLARLAPAAAPTPTPPPPQVASPQPVDPTPVAAPPSPPVPSGPTPEEIARKQYAAGVQLVREKKYADAIGALDQALVARPVFAEALIARGSARIGLGKFDDAVVDYSAARGANPALAAPLFGLAEAYRGLGRTDKAVEMYKAFAESSSPDAPPQLKQYALQNVQALSPR